MRPILVLGNICNVYNGTLCRHTNWDGFEWWMLSVASAANESENYFRFNIISDQCQANFVKICVFHKWTWHTVLCSVRSKQFLHNAKWSPHWLIGNVLLINCKLADFTIGEATHPLFHQWTAGSVIQNWNVLRLYLQWLFVVEHFRWTNKYIMTTSTQHRSCSGHIDGPHNRIERLRLVKLNALCPNFPF